MLDKPSTRVDRVRVADLLPGDLLLGSSRTVVTTPGRDADTKRRHVQLVVETADGSRRLVVWRADTLVMVRRPTAGLPARADLD